MTDSEIIQQILNRLNDHENRIHHLEGEGIKNPEAVLIEKKRKANARSKNDDLFSPIQKLLKDNFFAEARSDIEVCDALTLKLLTKKTPLRASVVNVLRALVKKELLIRDKIQKGKRSLLVYKQPS